jgi:hypothetical protein
MVFEACMFIDSYGTHGNPYELQFISEQSEETFF